MCVPLLARDRVVGALNVYRNGDDAAFSDEEVELVERFATMAALAYDSARQRDTLREQVQRDGLTGLLNHRACHERLREELAGAAGRSARRADRPRPLQGHQRRATGTPRATASLAAAAERLRSVVRDSDVVGRLGGEEFVLILPGVDAEAAEDCAERARAALAELTVARPAARRPRPASPPPRPTAARPTVPARERRRRAVLGQALRPRPDRALRARRACAPRREQRNEIAALLERGAGRDRASSSSPCVELATGRAGRLRGARALRRPSRGAARTSGSRRRTASASARSSRRSRCAPRSPSPAAPTAPSWRSTSRRARCSRPRSGPRCRQDLTGIVVELTEHELFGAEGELETELAALRARGARVALDDAGAGYAGLQQIIRIAPDILKLDRALVHGAHADGSRQALLEALIGFASHAPAPASAPRASRTSTTCARWSRSTSPTRRATASPGPARRGRPPAPEATAAGAAEIRAGLRVCVARRAASPARSRSGLAELADDLAAATTIADLGAADRARRRHPARRRRRRADARRPRDRRARQLLSRAPRQRARRALAARRLPRHRATSSTTASRARSSPATRPATRPSSPSSRDLGMATVLIVPVVLRPRAARAARGLPRPPAGLHRPRGRPRPRARAAVRRRRSTASPEPAPSRAGARATRRAVSRERLLERDLGLPARGGVQAVVWRRGSP